MARIELTYRGDAGPATIIAKIPTSDSEMKPVGLMLEVYEREHRAYHEVIPQLEIRTPTAYYNGRDGDDYCLILEDVGHLRGGEMSHTLVHGDFRLDNMFFAPDDELLLLDWQLVGRGDGFGDITPFLAGNFDSEVRREHEVDLLRLYHDTINSLGGGHVHFDDVLTSYRFSLNFWFAMYCYSAVTADPTNERGAELWERVVSRMADAVRQHESWELIGDHSQRPEVLS